MFDREDDIEKLEGEFPSLAGVAFAAARERTLAAGQSVLESEGSTIYEVFPDGSRVAVKEMEPPTLDVCGRKITIR